MGATHVPRQDFIGQRAQAGRRERAAARTTARATCAQMTPGPSAPGLRDNQISRVRAGLVLASFYCMDRNAVRNTLLAQHERIREDVAKSRMLAERLRGGEPVDVELDLALAQLRFDFDEHNR